MKRTESRRGPMPARKYACTVLLMLIMSLAGCSAQPDSLEKTSKDIFTMDTAINITVYTADPALGQSAADQAAVEFQRINNLTNRFAAKLSDPQASDVYRVNQSAGIAPVVVGADTLAMAQRAQYFAGLSGGAFDIAIGPIMDLWGFGGTAYHLPTDAEIKKLLPLADYRKIVIDADQKTIFLPEKGMIMDLGGIAKGYATDMAAKKIRDLGIKNALINAGGNVFAIGSKPDGQPWRIGIQDPRDANSVVAIVKVSDRAVVSSGDYQRYFEQDGVRYHHIIDPASGKQARSVMGTTIIMDNSTDADILSTTMFVLGPAKGMAFQKTLPGVEAVFITPGKEITYSSGLDGIIEFPGGNGYTLPKK